MTQIPQTLSTEAGSWWSRIVEEYGIEDQAGLLLLQTAMEAFDRMREAQAAIAREGAAVPDRFGQLKAHPLTTVERDSRNQMLSAVKQLNLDLEPLQESTGRPPESQNVKSIGG